MIFVDADFFIGFFYKQDAHHTRCLDISESIEEEITTSWDVVDEVTTKLFYNVNKQTALNFLSYLKSERVIIIYPNQSLFMKTKSVFEQQKHKHVSLTDCMNMAIMREKKITTVLSFDKIYEKNGFSLVK